MTELERIITSSRTKTAKTKDNYLRSIKLFETWAGTKRLTGQLVEDWRDELAKNLAPASVNSHLSAVRFVSRRLGVLRSDLRLDFAHGVEWLPKGDQVQPPRVLTADECRRLLATCSTDGSLIGLRDYAALQIGLHTGVRREGLVTAQVPKGRDITFVLKGKRTTVTTPLGDRVLAPVRWWLKEAGIKSGPIMRRVSKPTLDHGPQIGDALTTDGLYKALQRRAAAAGIEGFHPHAMRHAFITHARAAGVPEWRINQVTGHAQARMIDTYTHDMDPKPVGDYLPF